MEGNKDDHMDDLESKVQNFTKFFTLVLLKSDKPVTGYYILKRLESDLDKTASPTYVYDFLKDLKAEGFIEEVPTGATKRSQGFRLTDSGNKFVEHIFTRFGNLIEVAIQSKLKACANCGAKLYGDVHVETIDDKEMSFCCVHCAAAYKDPDHAQTHAHIEK
jgi:DNA-binding PadR family transcriptional regulator